MAGDFHCRLLLDGAPEAAWSVEGWLPVGTYVSVEDYPLTAGAGEHVLAFEIDHLGEVAESDENDNIRADTLDFIAGAPALRFNPAHVHHNYDEPTPSKTDLLRIAAAPPLLRETKMNAVEPRLADVAAASPAAMQRVMIMPVERLDAARFSATPAGAAAVDRRSAVAAALRTVSTGRRAALEDAWRPLVSRGEMSEPEALWLSGSFFALMNEEAIEALAANPAVARLWPDDRLLEPRRTPDAGAGSSEASLAQAWHLGAIGAPAAWTEGYDGDGIVIGHLDGGCAYDHPDLAGHLWDGSPAWPNHGWDCIDKDDDPYDGDTEFYHGTHTAELMILRCMPGYQADLVEALQFALDNGADLLSMSAGWIGPSDDLRETNRFNAEVLLAAGIPWVVAAGNGDNVGGHLPVPTDIASPGDAPNPFNPATVIRFDVAARGRVALSIYAPSGRLVRRLADGVLDAGGHRVTWDGTGDDGRALASGVYLARLEGAGAVPLTRKLTLLR